MSQVSLFIRWIEWGDIALQHNEHFGVLSFTDVIVGYGGDIFAFEHGNGIDIQFM